MLYSLRDIVWKSRIFPHRFIQRAMLMGFPNPHRYVTNTIRYDSWYLTCSKKLTGSQLSLPHGINRKLKCETKNNMMSVIKSSPVPLSWGSPVGKRNLRWEGFVEKVGFERCFVMFGAEKSRLVCLPDDEKCLLIYWSVLTEFGILNELYVYVYFEVENEAPLVNKHITFSTRNFDPLTP